jgi:WD40 repeat protein/predicted dehydrogenase
MDQVNRQQGRDGIATPLRSVPSIGQRPFRCSTWKGIRFGHLPTTAASVMAGVTIVLAIVTGWGSGLKAAPKDLPQTGVAETESLAPTKTLGPFSSDVQTAAWSRDGQRLALGLSNQVTVIDPATGKELNTYRPTGSQKWGQIQSLAYHPQAEVIVAGGYQALLSIDLQTGESTVWPAAHRGRVTGLAFSPTGQQLLTASDDGTAQLWDWSQRTATSMKGNDAPINGVCYGKDDQWIAAIGDPLRPTRAGRVVVWNSTGQIVQEWNDHRRAALCVATSSDGNWLISGGLDERAIVTNLGSGQPLGFFSKHSRPVFGCSMLPGGHAVASVGGGRAKGGNSLKVWQADSGDILASIDDLPMRMTSLAVDPFGQRAVTPLQDRSVLLWDLSRWASSPVSNPVGSPPLSATQVAAAEPADTTDGPVSAEQVIVAQVAEGPAAAADPAATATTTAGVPEAAAAVIRVGVIGLDTSHAPAFAGVLNDPKAEPDVAGCKIVAAYPKGSPDIASSVSRVPQYTEDFQKRGIEIVDSIDALLEKVDCVLLETNDGRPHLEQILPVLKAKKRCFIDKPMAGSLEDVIAIFELAKQYETPVWSSSSLRYVAAAQEIRQGKLGDVLGCEAFSPCSLEATHPDLFWYGIHGVELLYTVMGTGCQSAVRVHAPGVDVVVGLWEGGRVGTFRGIRSGSSGYGGRAFGSKGIADLGSYAGYRPLVVEIVKYFKTGVAPVSEAETMEMFAFMEAADESRRQNGNPVTLESVLAKARVKAAARLMELK